jgi:hypothetical protein
MSFKHHDILFKKKYFALVTTSARIHNSIVEEFLQIALLAKTCIPKNLDGKDAILQMKNGGSNNWRQMEWIGFWFEFFIETQIKPKLGNTSGPRYGNTTFDIELNHVWDLKAHPLHNDALILNDQDAIKNCIGENQGVGFIIVEGEVSYDDEGETFKKWHDNLKGRQSDYVTARIARQAPSRRRKASFSPKSIIGVWLDSLESLNSGQQDGWINGFQENMRNSNGRPRKAKFQFDTTKIPETHIVGKVVI